MLVGCDVLFVLGFVLFVGLLVVEYCCILVIGIGMILIMLIVEFVLLFLLLGKLLCWLNCVSYWFVNVLLWYVFRKLINVVCVSVCGLLLCKYVWIDYLMLYGVLLVLLFGLVDWLVNVYVCG